MSARLLQRLPVELLALTKNAPYLTVAARSLHTSARLQNPSPADKRVFITTPIFYCNAGERRSWSSINLS